MGSVTTQWKSGYVSNCFSTSDCNIYRHSLFEQEIKKYSTANVHLSISKKKHHSDDTVLKADLALELVVATSKS